MTDYSWLLQTSSIEVNGKTLACREITSKQREKLGEYQRESKESSLWAAYLVVCGCDEFKGMTPEELMDIASDQFILQVATEIAEISGIIAKKKSGVTKGALRSA